MAAAEKTVSALVQTQLPDFINGNHPQFKRFIELYYSWLEQNAPAGMSNTAGNTIYHAMQIGDYRDIDETPDEFIRYFKDELLPHFPENPSLDIKKILKSAREYYNKKGSEESLKWLFKALYDTDLEVNYPKEQILIASDGKWKKPRAFRITVGESNKNVDVNLLERKLVIGTISGATCIIESANRTIDETNGREVIEIYISNITKYFNNGEDIIVNYVDANGVDKVFRERIIGTLSNVRVDSNIRTDPTQRRRGLLYNVGDPVVITGGLGTSAEANDAAAIVGNVTRGSIEAVTPTFLGYGYREYYNTQVVVLRTIGVDDDEANSSTDLRVIALNTSACTSNSQKNYLESITYDKTSIEFLGDTLISAANFAPMTPNNINIILNATEEDYTDYFENFEKVWANGNNQFDALFVGYVGTPNGNTAISGTVSIYGDTSLTGTVEVYGNTAISGAVSVDTSLGTKTVTGTGTTFTADFSAGQFIRIKLPSNILSTHEIASVVSDTQLTLTTDFPFTVASQPAYKANLTVKGSGTSFSTELTVGDMISVNGTVKQVATIASDTLLTVDSLFPFSSSGNTIYDSVESTSTAVIGSNTKFSYELKAGQTLRVDGEDQTISAITNNEHLTVTSAYSTTVTNENAYRIGVFADYIGPDATDSLLIYDAQYSGSLAQILAGPGATLAAVNSGKTWTIAAVSPPYGVPIPANAESMIVQGLDFETVNTGGISAISVLEGGFGFRAEPSLQISSHYDTNWSEDYDYNNSLEQDTKIGLWQDFSDLGVLAHVYINSGGTEYTVGDGLIFVGRGYGANGYVQSVASNGAITSVVLDNRGEGYLERPEIIVNRSSVTYDTLSGTATVNNRSNLVTGSSTTFLSDFSNKSVIRINSEVRRVVAITNNTILLVNSAFTANATGQTIQRRDGDEASLTGYLFGDGFQETIDTSAIGRVQDIRLLYRGYDYVSTPTISLKVLDTVVDALDEADTVYEQEYIYQGTTLQNSTFRANVKSYNRTTNVLRLYNYSGTINVEQSLVTANNLYIDVDVSERVPVPVRGVLVGTGPSTFYPESVADLPNPMYYGNGRARANAQFANGLIEFNGFFLNTDGFPSADKVLQDNTIYHNFSYVIQAEKDLIEYENTIKNISHPAGMSLTAKRIAQSEDNAAIVLSSNADVFLPKYDSSRVSVLNSRSNTITGYGTDFTSSIGGGAANTKVNVGDLFILNYSGAFTSNSIGNDPSLRTQTKVVTEVLSNTSLNVEGDFIITGQGKANSNTVYNALTGTVTINPAVTGTAVLNPAITGTVNVNERITGTVNVYTTNVVVGNATSFTTQVLVNDILTINNQVRRITSITNNQHLLVNAVFSNAGTDNVAFLSNVVVLGIGTSFVGNVFIGDIFTVNNEIREVTFVSAADRLEVNAAFTYPANTQLLYLRSNVVTGSGTNFDPQINVGDIITINSEPRTVTVVVNDTTLEVNSNYAYHATGASIYKQNNIILGSSTNFTGQLAANDIIKVNNQIREVITVTDGTHITVNSPFIYFGTGNGIQKLQNTIVQISGNVNAISDMIVAGDNLSFNIAVANVYKAQTGTVQVHTQNGKVVGTATAFSTDLVVGDLVAVNNEIRQVVNIASGTVMNVNSAFEDAATGATLYRRATVQNANVVSISSNNITLNIAVPANVSGLVYHVIPNYSLGTTLSGTVNVLSSSVVVTGNTTSPNVTYFVGNVAVGMSITVNNETRVIASITNNDTLTVTSAFTNAAQDKYLTTNQSYDYRVVTLTKDLG